MLSHWVDYNSCSRDSEYITDFFISLILSVKKVNIYKHFNLFI